MGYTFWIGEAVLEDADLRDEEGGYALTVDISVKTLSLPDAPRFEGDELTGNSNERSPSYSTWTDFCRDEGLYELFYNSEGHLHGGHPGNVRLTFPLPDDGTGRARSPREEARQEGPRLVSVREVHPVG